MKAGWKTLEGSVQRHTSLAASMVVHQVYQADLRRSVPGQLKRAVPLPAAKRDDYHLPCPPPTSYSIADFKFPFSSLFPQGEKNNPGG